MPINNRIICKQQVIIICKHIHNQQCIIRHIKSAAHWLWLACFRLVSQCVCICVSYIAIWQNKSTKQDKGNVVLAINFTVEVNNKMLII